MRDHPILFSAPMVCALLEGRKTMTRRVLSPENLRIWTGGLDHGGKHVKPDSDLFAAAMNNARNFRLCDGVLAWVTDPAPHQRGAVLAQWQGRIPYNIGERLWVRETYYQIGHWEPVTGAVTRKRGRQKWRFVADDETIAFDPPTSYRKGRSSAFPFTSCWHQRLGRFMPRAYSRLTAIITGVKIERLQAISPQDAWDEGVERQSRKVRQMWLFGATQQEREEIYKRACVWEFEDLWKNLHGDDSWAANPYVVALNMRVIRANVDSDVAGAA
ncbi:hypothetical protein OOZ54_12540 [Rhodopseudomonas palustris]|uniref:hypothetical protein n=1 Tax=Rhodopseudomonas palustris TaxID=1076 RepID=UPI0022F11C8B|nr:hypothetical protein [Rhodopseudomonas palustris]WBU27522.1 hypothetical protein OOZ54_12540 [Rhodopseudomonas palustris]